MILLVTAPWQLALKRQQEFQGELISWKPRCGATPTRSYSRTSTILRRIHPKAGLKAKLNSTIMATFILHTTITAVQSVSESELLQTLENFEGGLVDT